MRISEFFNQHNHYWYYVNNTNILFFEIFYQINFFIFYVGVIVSFIFEYYYTFYMYRRTKWWKWMRNNNSLYRFSTATRIFWWLSLPTNSLNLWMRSSSMTNKVIIFINKSNDDTACTYLDMRTAFKEYACLTPDIVPSSMRYLVTTLQGIFMRFFVLNCVMSTVLKFQNFFSHFICMW